MADEIKKAAEDTAIRPGLVAVSGGFDPVHIGHVKMFQEAKKLGKQLVVILNGDEWLRRKKGYVFMEETERAAIIGALRAVDLVCILNSEKDDVAEALREIRPEIFANGGDRRDEEDIPESGTCRLLGIKMVFNVGGDKAQSSSKLVADASKAVRMVEERDALDGI